MNKLFLLSAALLMAAWSHAQEKPRTVIFIFDGLRGDMITEAQMPNLYAFQQIASAGAYNHNVFPTVTRVNATSYTTGSYPQKHGIMGNALHIPGIAGGRVFDTGTASHLMTIDSLLDGNLVTAKTLGEVMQEAGHQLMVFSSGSTGQAFLQNPKRAGWIVNPNLILPKKIEGELFERVGNPKEKINGRYSPHQWATDAFLAFALDKQKPLVSAIWLSQPDGAQHAHGIGSEEALTALKLVDQQFGRVLQALEKPENKGKFNLIITTDHGFVAYQGETKLADALIQAGFKSGPDSDDVVVADGAVFVKDHAPKSVKEIVDYLQQQTWVGPIFTKAYHQGDSLGVVPGTLSFETIHWNHPSRNADILVTYNWYEKEGPRGYQGVADNAGVAGHGGLSKYEIRTPLLVYGPSFKAGFENPLPTACIDIVPTILSLYHLPIPSGMDGRVMREFLKDPQAPESTVKKKTYSSKVEKSWGSYQMELFMSEVDGYRYFDYGKVERKLKQ